MHQPSTANNTYTPAATRTNKTFAMVQPAVFQTYPNRLHKRQRTSSTSAGGDDAAPRAPLKKSQRPKLDDYNHKVTRSLHGYL
jgi:hypothetical protein